MNTLANVSVLVLGLGESGLAMARWCARSGARVCVADTRADPPGREQLVLQAAGAELVLGPFAEALLDGVELVAISPGIDHGIALVAAARARGLRVVGEMTLFGEALVTLGARAQTRVIAITGTNGKTTTTALTAAMCRASGLDAVAAGNISPAALSVLADRLDAGQVLPQCWVLELSSFQLETLSALEMDAATVLNVSDDHLDRHGDMASYAAVKSRIFTGDGVQVLNRDDALVMAMAGKGRDVRTFGTNSPAARGAYGLIEKDGETWLACGDEALIATSALQLVGRHNHSNALAALALCEAIGCKRPALLHALQHFRGLAHRVEPVGMRGDDVTYYDDSKGTNVGATLAAIEGLGRPVVLIAGGDGKGQDFTPLADAVAAHARAVVLIGRDAARIEAALASAGVPLVHAADMDAAVQAASQLAEAGDGVLLSPACASLDMFRNYAHRAEVFIAAVRALPGVTAA